MANNGQSVLVVRSVTSAMRGQKLLESSGISAYVQRNTAPNSNQGCGYGIRIGRDSRGCGDQGRGDSGGLKDGLF